MRGASRDAYAAGQERLDALLAARPADASGLGQDLFGVTSLLDGSAALRRAFTDPSRPAADKEGLAHGLLDGKVGTGAVEVTATLAAGRWSTASDLVDALEQLAVQAVLAAAETAGRLDTVEDELFRFSRAVAASPELRDAFSVRSAGSERKAALVGSLLAGKAAPETVLLSTQAATAPRGLRTEQALERYVDAAAARRDQLVAHVVSAVALTEAERGRLAAALRRVYGRDPQVNVDVDPSVIGGLRVQVGGELIDGTMIGRLEDAKRRLAG